MFSESAPAEPYNGALLSMNACGATKPSKERIQGGILDAWHAAIPRPSIILLQEFTSPNKELEKTGGILDALEQASGNPWTYTRQWADTRQQRDTVVLFNAAEFQGKPLPSGNIHNASSSEINKIFVGSKLNKSKKKVLSYATRWSGVQLAVNAAAPLTGKPPRASRVQLLIISYHGRERREQAEEENSTKYKGTSLKSPIKKLLARDFIAEVAKAALNCNILFGAHPEGMYSKSIPALIAGDWNAEIELIENFESSDPSLWKCSNHAPIRDQPQLSVRTTADGELKADIDYCVAINHNRDHELSCQVEVTHVQALVHALKYREEKVFDHDPLLVQFCVKPRYPNGRRLLEERPPQRLAAQIATERIRRLTGQQMRERARTHPVSVKLELLKTLLDDEEEEEEKLVLPIEKKRVSEKKKKTPEIASQAPPPLPPQTTMNGERTLVLSRYPKSYDLAKSAKQYTEPQLKAAVKAMALDALGIENARGKKISIEHGAFNQPWWPKEVTTKLSTTEFDTLTDTRRVKLYNDLQDLLLAKGIGAEHVVQVANNESGSSAAPPQSNSNILTAKGLSSFVRKNLNRVVSQAREP
jgi:hypothetical protein